MTPKQKAFCDYYLISLNATESAIKAGYSKKTAYAIGEENLRKLELKKYIDERLNKIEDKRFLTLEECLIDISEIAKDTNLDIKDRLKAYDLILKRYPLEINNVDNKIEVVVKKA